ncbi:PepSY-associated TM helix domain-containing protein [Rothia nasisuis]|uniref:PepSY-associated TM helix domain-containing protein n=2 Tax=Rothia nasisuis TaxID=2109647 RepID=UPI001F2F115E|nr:PepSY-associated TM helix domain-containing protein [Rothia nasisuis]
MRTPSASSAWLHALARRIHFYAGILVAPFIAVAAASGALYALAPQIEKMAYSHVLTAPATETRLNLDEQVAAANAYAGQESPVAVRPAVAPGTTTRVMYADETLGESTTRTIFLDPGTGQVLGEYPVYGSSGALPFRTWVSGLHRNLHLGEVGRIYSELAASWLWVIAISGLVLWGLRARRLSRGKDALAPRRGLRGYLRTLSRHSALGFWVALGLLFLSATGLTWSTYAGANVSDLRAALSWTTPSVSTSLTGAATDSSDSADHAAPASGSSTGAPITLPVTSYTKVLSAARAVNIDSVNLEIRPGADAETAWVVQETQRFYPTQVDSVAINPYTYKVVDRTDFADYPLAAKLTRWGIDLHMGVHLGWVNQLVMFGLALATLALSAWGYVMWWQRRPRSGGKVGPAPTLASVRQVPFWVWVLLLSGTLAVGFFLPVLGASLLVFVVADLAVQAIRWLMLRSRL